MATKPETAGRWRVGDGEEARLTPGAAAAAEVWSRGFLPLRVRTEGSFRLRPAFPGTAVVLGEATYEVLSETELPEDGLVVCRLRRWPEGEVIRDRVVYGLSFLRAAEAERVRAQVRARARPWRFLLYLVVGLLPEETQERLCDRLGLYAVTATLVSGLVESLGAVLLLLLLARASEGGGAIMLVVSLPGFILLVLPGLGRAFGAVFLRETGGSAPVFFVFETLRALGALRERRDRSFVPLTRSAFWERLGRPDTVEAASDGTLVFRGLLPHLTWGGSTRLSVGHDFWGVVPEPPVLDRGRLVYAYRLGPLGDAPVPGGPPPSAPPATAYAEETPRPLPAELPAGAGRRSARPLRGRPGHSTPRRRGAPRPGDAPGPIRAEPLPLRTPLGLAPPRADRLPRPPRRRARGSGRSSQNRRLSRAGIELDWPTGFALPCSAWGGRPRSTLGAFHGP